MKNKLLLDAVREVKHTKSRFLSILLLSALAVAFLAGLRTTRPDMERTADDYFDGQNLMDVQVLSTLGLTDDDIAALKNQPGVAAAQGSYTADAFLPRADKELIVKVHSLSPTGLNAPQLLEGKLPEAPDQCVTEPALLRAGGLEIGDKITLDTGEDDFKDALKYREFTIVGTVHSPLYIFNSQRGTSSLGTGRVTAFVLLQPEAFDMETYTDAYLSLEGAQGLLTYSDAYRDLAEDAADGLKPLGEQRAGLRYGDVIGEANEKLADAQIEFDDAERDAQKKLQDAKVELEDARKELDDGWQKWDDGRETLRRESGDGEQEISDNTAKLWDAKIELDDGEAEYKDGLSKLEDGKITLADAEQKLADGQKEYDDGAATLATSRQDYQDGQKKYQDGLKDYGEGQKKYQDGLKTYEAGKKEYEDGLKQYQAGLKTYQDGEKTYLDGVQKYNEGKKKLEDGQKEYNDGVAQSQTAKKQLDDAKKKLADASSQLDAGYAQYESGLAQYSGGLQQYQDGLGQYQQGLAAFEGQVSGLLLSLSQVPGFPSFPSNSAFLDALADPTLAATVDAVAGVGTAATLTATRATLAQTDATLSATKTQLDFVKVQLDGAAAALSSGSDQYRAGRKEYTDGKKKYDDGLVTLADAKKELDTGWAELGDAKKELLTAEATLAEGQKELETNRIKLEDAKKELDTGKLELDDAKKELADAALQLEDAKAELADGLQKLQDGEAELADAKVTLEDGKKEYATGLSDLTKAQGEVTDARIQLDDGWREYRDGQRQLEDGRLTFQRETTQAQRDLDQAELDLNDGEAEYKTGLLEYQDGKKEAETELNDARKKLNDARRDIGDIEHCKWYFLTRETNTGFVSYGNDAERMGHLADLFPIIFFLVAALVCLTTMTRMVEEQRVQIGGMKALGYSRRAIAFKYVGYGFAASLLGGVIGLFAGVIGIPLIIYNAWKALYTLPDILILFPPAICIISVSAAVVTVTGAALWASLGALTAVPAQLMRPRAPTAGKRVLLERITPLWKRLSFSLKVAIRNLFRYKKRFFMTVVGIGGCTALIIAGFGLRDSIFGVEPIQFDELFHYHSQVGLAEDVSADELAAIVAYGEEDETIDDLLPCYTANLTVEGGNRSMDATLMATNDLDRVPDFTTMRTRKGHKPVSLEDSGAVITEKLAQYLGISVGDTILLDDGDRRTEVPVTGITENYVYHYVYLSQDYYQSLYGAPITTNLFLCRYGAQSPAVEDAAAEHLMKLSGVSAVSHLSSSRDMFHSSVRSVDYAVIIIIGAAAALAFVVLYNLTNINITERLRELATLKVLGFYDGELSAYVYRENIFLTLFGIGIGLVLGAFLHQYLILTVEVDMLMFGRVAYPMSYGYAVLLTALFSFLVNLAAHRRLKKIDMVESLKTVE